MTTSIARARADLDAGRLWKARARLSGLLATRQDPEVLDLLATVHYEMHDLPAAGALWFATGRDDEVARTAIAAWRERHGNAEARWNSVPAPVRRNVRSQHLRRLQGDARRTAGGSTAQDGPDYAYSGAWWEGILSVGGAALFFLWVIAMVGIGVWTVFQWIWG